MGEVGMVERVARAICVARGLEPDEPGGAIASFHDNSTRPQADVAVPQWRHYVEAARAAIEAMRCEPGTMPKAMVFALHEKLGDTGAVPAGASLSAIVNCVVDAALTSDAGGKE